MRWIRRIGTGVPSWGGWNVLFLLVPVGLALVLVAAIPTIRRDLSGKDSSQKSPAPQRIITIAPNSAEIVCALGACDAIIGVSKFCVYPSELTERVKVGGLFDPDLEKIIALRPDLVVLRGRSESVERMCRDRGVAVYHDKTDTLAGVETCIKDLGRLLARDKEADALAQRFRGRIERIRQRTADGSKPRVLLTVSRRPDRLASPLTTGKGTFLNEMLEIAGGENVFGQTDMAYPQVSLESIVARRPDVIIEMMPEVTLTPTLKRQMVDQWRTVGSIPAVAEDRIVFLTDDHCLIPSPRYVEIIEKVSRILHPEVWRDR